MTRYVDGAWEDGEPSCGFCYGLNDAVLGVGHVFADHPVDHALSRAMTRHLEGFLRETGMSLLRTDGPPLTADDLRRDRMSVQ